MVVTVFILAKCGNTNDRWLSHILLRSSTLSLIDEYDLDVSNAHRLDQRRISKSYRPDEMFYFYYFNIGNFYYFNIGNFPLLSLIVKVKL